MTGQSFGPGRVAAGISPLATAVVVAGVLGICGLAFAASPFAVLGMIAGLSFVAASLAQPKWGYASALFLQVVAPLYIGLPIVPLLPPLPLSFMVIFVVAPLIFLRTDWGQWKRAHVITKAFAAYGIALALSILFSDAPGSSFNALLRCYVVPLVAYLMTRCLVRTIDDVKLPLNTLLLSCVIASLYAVVEFIIARNPVIEMFTTPDMENMFYWQQKEIGADSYVYRSFSLELNPLFFATITCMLFPYAVARYGVAQGLTEKLKFGTAACICVAGIVATFSRGALLAVAVSAIGLAVILPRLRYIVTVPLAAGAVAGLLSLPWLGPMIWARFSDTENVSFRFKLWQTAWHMFLDHPVTGVGLNGFADYKLATIRTYEIGPFPEYAGNATELVVTADNTWLQLAAEAGLVGVITFAAVFLVAAPKLLRAARSQAQISQVLAGALAAGMISYLINGLTITAYTAYTPTILLGVLLALTATIDENTKPRPPG